MVEDVFALAVRFQIDRRDADDLAPFLRDEMRGVPAGAAADRARLFQRQKEAVGGEGIAAGAAAVPILGRDGIDSRHDGDGEFGHAG